MKRKFNHHEIFKIVIKTMYISTGIIMLILYLNGIYLYITEFGFGGNLG